ncbi:right-handed parallel beta-helix repeat-containing protein [Aliikangiella sp. G2MR2-5]|uniref:InlB B-repeat-containing protein n=1 Tax=Aliikangiella sp. G2MR2-5 TaxID=2788943 RepID=UPI0018A908E6|nr:NosD domain-containing protein [Aliikangiella sp. G2MR2-5]
MKQDKESNFDMKVLFRLTLQALFLANLIACASSGGGDEPEPPASQKYTLEIGEVNDGEIEVNSSNMCQGNCDWEYDADTRVELEAIADSGYQFVRWQGDVCNGSNDSLCSFSMSRDILITAEFTSSDNSIFRLSVKPQTGGSVVGGNDINCGAVCSVDLVENTLVELTAIAESGYEFSHWSDEQCGSSQTDRCEFNLTSNAQIVAHFSVVETNCAQSNVLCVDDTSGAMQEYEVIQDAIDDAGPGDIVKVFAGTYEGFDLYRSGDESNKLMVMAAEDNVVLNRHGDASDAIIRISDANHVIVDGFTVDNQDGTTYGIAARGASATDPMVDVTVRNNKVFNSPSTNIYLSQLSYSLVEGNEAAYSQASHGIYLANGGSDNTTLRGNISYQNAKNGIHFNGDLTVGSGTDGLHTGIILEKNTIYDNAANGFDMDGVRDSVIRNNLIYSNGRHGIRGFVMDAASGPANFDIYNNTVADNGGWSIKMTDDEGGHRIFNNILIDSSGSISLNSNQFTADYNATSGTYRVSSDSEGATMSLTQWQSQGWGSHSFESSSDALFSSNYRLGAGSPAIDAGVNSFDGANAPTDDILGASRPSGNGIDMGAFEKQ